ncbi:MAG: methyltransferase domain-containing protein [Solirubrobacterales bacterium]|nr:methyltransferase domain-containing protein [Solirubrobacterales bacterium]MBV9809461.1 methyltransferase domain-containing protein [Solirubrobacterales bacterium]
MSTSLVYRSTLGYELLMRVLYGRHYTARMEAVAAEVPDGASVLELCCGPGTLYLHHLRGRTTSYVGIDVNPGFVERLRRQGVDARRLDLAHDEEPLPGADVVVLQASLYHFLPRAERIIDRMFDAARERVIVSEPVRNLASSELALIARLGRRAADPGVGGHAQRFTEQTLAEEMARYRERILRSFPIPGGREMVYVLAASR